MALASRSGRIKRRRLWSSFECDKKFAEEWASSRHRHWRNTCPIFYSSIPIRSHGRRDSQRSVFVLALTQAQKCNARPYTRPVEWSGYSSGWAEEREAEHDVGEWYAVNVCLVRDAKKEKKYIKGILKVALLQPKQKCAVVFRFRISAKG